MADTNTPPVNAVTEAVAGATSTNGTIIPENINLETVYDIPVQVTVVLGRTTMQVGQLLKLGRGAVIELDKKVGEAIDILINNRLVARGEVVVVEERIGITLTEVLKAEKH